MQVKRDEDAPRETEGRETERRETERREIGVDDVELEAGWPGGEAAEAEAAAEDADEGAQDRIADLEAENAELKDRMLRLVAEAENTRRRAEREAGDARRYAVTKFAADVLGVADNLRRALEAVPEEDRAEAEGAFKDLIVGVEMTERELQRALESHGVRRIEAQGQRFDPKLHQAMFEVEDAAKPAGTVVQVVQEGYVIADRPLRAAMVGVSKGGPKSSGNVDDDASSEGETDSAA